MSFERVSLAAIPMPSAAYLPTADGYKAFFKSRLHAMRRSFEASFDYYMLVYRQGEERSTRFKEAALSTRFEWDDFEELREARRSVEMAAKNTTLALDGLLAELRFSMDGREQCRDDGPVLGGEVTVDRALDAIGNYIRHGHEWYSWDRKEGWPSKKQTHSIRAIAKLFTSHPIEDEEDAYVAFTAVSLPAASVLDLLGDFAEFGQGASYDSVEAKMRMAGFAAIDRHFAALDGV